MSNQGYGKGREASDYYQTPEQYGSSYSPYQSYTREEVPPYQAYTREEVPPYQSYPPYSSPLPPNIAQTPPSYSYNPYSYPPPGPSAYRTPSYHGYGGMQPPRFSPELMKLVEAAIKEVEEHLVECPHLESIKKLVSRSEKQKEEDASVTADSEEARKAEQRREFEYLDLCHQVADIILLKMGGSVTSFSSPDQSKGINSSPELIIHGGSSIIAVEIVPFLPCNDINMMMKLSPRTRMARGVLYSLESCTLNRSISCKFGIQKSLLNTVKTILYEELKKVDMSKSPASSAESHSHTEKTPVPSSIYYNQTVIEQQWDITPLLKSIELVFAHGMNVQDYYTWLKTVSDIIPTGRARDLLTVLERAMVADETKGPCYSFEFDGENSGLLGPGDSKWPFLNGYAFATWMYVESFIESTNNSVNAATIAADIAAEAAAKSSSFFSSTSAATAAAAAGGTLTHMPRLFSFLSPESYGIEAYFHRHYLVVETANSKSKKQSFHFSYPFETKRWYFVGIEHTIKQSLLTKAECEVKLYVDGKYVEGRPLELPRVARPLAFCCIGTNPPAAMAGMHRYRRQCPLFAEMGPIYIFKEPIGDERMERLANRGGDHVSSFGSGASPPWRSNSEQMLLAAEASFALDAELSSRLYLLYHPSLVTGRYCPDISPFGTIGLQKRPAEVLGTAHVSSRFRIEDSIWAFGEGGPLSLLSLTVAAVNKKTLQPVVINPKLSSLTSDLFPLIFRIIARAMVHPLNVEELIKSSAPRVLANLLRYFLSIAHLNIPSKREGGAFREGMSIDEDKRWIENDNQRALEFGDGGKEMMEGGLRDWKEDWKEEEIVSSITTLINAPKFQESFKIKLYISLLLDLKLWFRCPYGLQKKVLSQLSDMVFTEQATLRAAGAVQLLLDGCRRCYWVVRESESLDGFCMDSFNENQTTYYRSIGEINSLVDELLVVVELLVGSSQGSHASHDAKTLVHFVLDCPQPNQVARVLHLIYRLVIQPNASRANSFVTHLLANGGAEMMLTLLRREAELGENPSYLSSVKEMTSTMFSKTSSLKKSSSSSYDSNSPIFDEKVKSSPTSTDNLTKFDLHDKHASQIRFDSTRSNKSALLKEVITKGGISHSSPTSKSSNVDLLTGVTLSVNAESLRYNFRTLETGDGIMVGLITLLGALVNHGHIHLYSPTSISSGSGNLSTGGSGLAFSGGLSSGLGLGLGFMGGSERGIHLVTANSEHALGAWLAYGLQKAFQCCPNRLLTDKVYAALLSAVVRLENTTEDRMNIFDSQHKFENSDLLLSLLRALPYASLSLQHRAIQDILLLACCSYENRYILTSLNEWPEWILEILLTNCERDFIDENKNIVIDDGDSEISYESVNDLIFSFLIITLEHSMRLKDGWKDIEQTFHTLEWLSMIGGSNFGEKRKRREEAMAIVKRKLLSSLLDFASRELLLQTQVVAAAAAGVASENLSPRAAKAEAESAAQTSMYLAENSLVLLMLLEDFLRLQSLAYQNTMSDSTSDGSIYASDASTPGRRSSAAAETDGISLDMLASMAGADGKISLAAMEKLNASSAAEPYDSVRSAFVCYGSLSEELSASWRKRSRMWYGVGLPPRTSTLGGGAGGWDSWSKAFEKDKKGDWVDLDLIRKAITMLRSLLLDESGPGGSGGGLVGGMGGGAGHASGTIEGLMQLLDSDQTFFTMLRIVLVAMREEDEGGESQIIGSAEPKNQLRRGRISGEYVDFEDTPANELEESKIGVAEKRLMKSHTVTDGIVLLAMRRAKTSLLWRVLAPLLTMGQLNESKRQRVLVTASIIYTEIFHAIDSDREILRKQYIEMIIPPFSALLRRWRPLLSGLLDLTDYEGRSPLATEDQALATDALPSQAALSLITPSWASSLASPPASMALAMAAAGTGGDNISSHISINTNVNLSPAKASSPLSRTSPYSPEPSEAGESDMWQSVKGGLLSAAGIHSKFLSTPVTKAQEKALAAKAARDQERTNKLGSGRGMGAIAMATAWQRRTVGDKERAKRWTIEQVMSQVWKEAKLTNVDNNLDSAFSFNLIVLSNLISASMHIQNAETKRRLNAFSFDEKLAFVGLKYWKSLIRRLNESQSLFGLIPSSPDFKQKVFFKLDVVENSLRMRKRMKINYKGTNHEGAAWDYELRQENKNKNNENSEKNDNNSNKNVSLSESDSKSKPSDADLICFDELKLEEKSETSASVIGSSSETATETDKKDAENDKNEVISGFGPTLLADAVRLGTVLEKATARKETEEEVMEEEKEEEEETDVIYTISASENVEKSNSFSSDKKEHEIFDSDQLLLHKNEEKKTKFDGFGSKDFVNNNNQHHHDVNYSINDLDVDIHANNMNTFDQMYQHMHPENINFEIKEKIILETNVLMVQPLRILKGMFKITTSKMYFIMDEKYDEEKDEDNSDKVLDQTESKSKSKSTKFKDIKFKSRTWLLSSIRGVMSRRYLLRRCALEIFMVDRTNYFFSFADSDERKRVHSAIVKAKPPFLNDIYTATQRPDMLFEKSHITERWRLREMSNFQYLMHLNTLAGRTFNDITQYPVFPWIISDYSSKELDLSSPYTYRDLSKPIGALNRSRLEKFLERYENFDDPIIPKFHYGSHYSSAGTVLYYLMRIEPFSSLSINLQGGKFDTTDRLFGDVMSTWNGVIEDMADVKELVPEFFYLPEMFTNVNDIDFGKGQLGEKMNDVKLPPWAKNPIDFVQKQKQALESEFVSSNLHHWIDLIFGYKQKGRHAVESNNLFFYLTYEDSVDIDKIADPGLRKATQDQIAYFGQTPSQLLTKPHPKRLSPEHCLHLQTIFRNPDSILQYTVPHSEKLNVPASKILTTGESIIVIDQNLPSCQIAVHKWQPNTPDGRGWPFLFKPGRTYAAGSGTANLMMNMMLKGSFEEPSLYPQVNAIPSPLITDSNSLVAISPDGKYLFMGGNADCSLKVISVETAKVIESAFVHSRPITCLSLSYDGSTLVTGSFDSTILIWRVLRTSGLSNPIAPSSGYSGSESHDPAYSVDAAATPGSTGSRNAISDASALDHRSESASDSSSPSITDLPRRNVRRIEGPLHILRGHLDTVIACAVSADLDLIVSCSKSRGILLHSIMKGRFLRRLDAISIAHLIAISSEGIIVLWNAEERTLQSFTINGVFVSGVSVPAEDGQITSIEVSSDGLNLAVGTSVDVDWGERRTSAGAGGGGKEEHGGLSYGDNHRKREAGGRGKSLGGDEGEKRGFKNWREEMKGKNNGQDNILGPSISLLDIYSLKVTYRFRLPKGSNVSALALTDDDTNLVSSTSNAHLTFYSNPVLSVKMVDQMLRLGWEGSGFLT